MVRQSRLVGECWGCGLLCRGSQGGLRNVELWMGAYWQSWSVTSRYVMSGSVTLSFGSRGKVSYRGSSFVELRLGSQGKLW